MFIARTSALGWARDESRWKAVVTALRNSSLGHANGDVEIDVWETEAEKPYVDQMGRVCIDAEDMPEDLPEDENPLSKVDKVVIPEHEVRALDRLLGAISELETDIDTALRFAVYEEDSLGARRWLKTDAEGAAEELGKLIEMRQ